MMYRTDKPYKEQILSLIQNTWETNFVSVKNSALTKKFSLPEFSSTDGVGTKGVYHWNKRTFKEAVIDALAMNLNDLVLMRARPYKLQNHILIPEDDHDAILEIIEIFVSECKMRGIAIVGGETSVHDNIKGMDISVSVDGFIEELRKNKFQTGDVLIGLKSNGIHSNGFTRIRELYGDEYREEFTHPTLIYSDKILDIDKRYEIHGMTHITGGAFSKIKGFLGEADAEITNNHKLKPHNIFYDIYHKCLNDGEMYKTFNCGVGFVLGVPKKSAYGIVSEFNLLGLKADVIGEVHDGSGKVKIESMFSNENVIL